MFTGRRKPYTARGIARLKCTRCGAPGVHQWNCCANGNRFTALCTECDIGLNRMAMEFMRMPNAEALMERYERRQRGRDGR
jgi:hypothetical protein